MNRLIAASGVVLVVAVAGCGGGSPDAAPAAPDRSSPAASPPASATPDPSPGVTPASGPLVNGIQVSFHVPPGWRGGRGEVKWQQSFDSEPLAAHGELTEQYWPEAKATPATLKEMVAVTKDSASPDTHWHRLPDLTIAGLPFYHLAATEPNLAEEEYGSILRHREVVFEFSWFTDSSTAAKRRQLTDQILASVAVK